MRYEEPNGPLLPGMDSPKPEPIIPSRAPEEKHEELTVDEETSGQDNCPECENVGPLGCQRHRKIIPRATFIRNKIINYISREPRNHKQKEIGRITCR